MTNFYTILLLIISILATFNYVSAQTNVAGGNVSGTWTLAGSPYLINGSIQIPNGQTLTIEPGVTVNFQGSYKLYVQGRILSIGTVSDTITFIAQDTTSGWKGIRFSNTPTSNDTSKFIYCKIQYGRANGTGEDSKGGGFYFNNFSKTILSNNLISNNFSISDGGGIYCFASSPIIINNKIVSNFASTDGGGIMCRDNSNPLIESNIVSYNKINGFSGGICCYSSTPKITNNTVSNNYGNGIACINNQYQKITNNIITYNQSTYYGGGIYITNCTNAEISNNSILNNNGRGFGGGIFFSNCNYIIIRDNIIKNNISSIGGGIDASSSSFINIKNNIISQNAAFCSDNTSNRGGGVYFFEAKGSLTNNLIVQNSAYDGGGIYFTSTDFLNVSYNEINFNTTSNNGGGIFLNVSSSRIVNNYISNNLSNNGGAIYCLISNSLIINNLITNNSSTIKGGAVFITNSQPVLTSNTIVSNNALFGGALYFQYNSDPMIRNNILYRNEANNLSNQIYISDEESDPSFYNCNIQGGSSAFELNGNFYTGTYQNNIDSDPLFVAPTAGSGTSYDGTTADWSLQAGSPCINAGTTDITGLNLPSTDIAGNPRISDGRIDIGAYEHLGTSINNPITNNLINIYPNPNNGKFLLYLENYESKNYALEIYNITGQIIYSKNYENTVVLAENIDISEFESGIYLVKVNDGEKNLYKNVLICK